MVVTSSGAFPQQATPLSEPAWLEAMRGEADRRHDELYDRPTFDGLDLDIAMLQSPSPAWKIARQRSRDAARRREMQGLWERINAAAANVARGMLR